MNKELRVFDAEEKHSCPILA